MLPGVNAGNHTSRSSFVDALSLFAARLCATINNINAGNACTHTHTHTRARAFSVRLNLNDDARYHANDRNTMHDKHGVAMPRFNFRFNLNSICARFSRTDLARAAFFFFGWRNEMIRRGSDDDTLCNPAVNEILCLFRGNDYTGWYSHHNKSKKFETKRL